MSFREAPYGHMTWVNTAGDIHPTADRRWAWGTGKGGHGVFWNANHGVVFAAHGRKPDVPFPVLLDAAVLGPDPLAAGDKP